MKILLIVSALVAVAVARPKILAPLLAKDSPTAIEGEYIVVFSEELEDDEVSSHKELVNSMLLNTTGIKIKSEYQINGKGFRGYAAKMDHVLVESIRAMHGVKYVERNQIVTIMQTQCELQSGAPWNLVRTTVREWNTNPNDPPNEYEYKKEDGEGVEVYIIDTGIDETHPLFEGRADRGVDFVDDPPPSNGDPNGHGTHIAGIVAALIYGLARSATCIGVRVFNAAGVGTSAGVIDGINYVAEQKRQNPSKKIVANLSFGGGFSNVLNDATNACVEAGVHMTVPAGNENYDACTRSPASAELAFTAGASDTTDSFAAFSNYGSCIDIIAPGVDIISTTPNGGTASFSGTSMSSPHLAGVIAKALSTTSEYDEPAAMKTYLKSIATKDKITRLPPGTDNDLLFFDCK